MRTSEIKTFPMELKVEEIYNKFFRQFVNPTSTITTNQENKFQHLLDVRTNQDPLIPPSDEDIWIFGYGSLVWKADFPYIDRRSGFVRGYQRRFYQHSIDHRGTELKPGRVVTLVPTGNENDRVYGVAYRIAVSHKRDVLGHLDYREKNGYERCTLQFQEFPEETGEKFDIIMYIATKDNESFAGAIWQLPRIAEQIFTSAGPSGPNREYLFNLASAMRALFPGVHDEHLYDLEREVLKRIEKDEAIALERAFKKEIAAIIASFEKKSGSQLSLEQTIKLFDGLRNFCGKAGWKEELLTKELLMAQEAN